MADSFLKDELAGATATNPEWTTPGKTTDVAPLVGGLMDAYYPHDRGVRTLAQFHVKADILSAPATLTDTAQGASSAEPAFGSTELRYSGTASAVLFSSAIGALAAPVDLSKGNIRFRFRAGPNLFSTNPIRINLYSSGSPSSPSANYTQLDLGYSAGILAARTATDWGRWQAYGIPGGEIINGPATANGIITVGTGANLNAITYAALSINGTTGCQMAMGDIQFVPNALASGRIILGFDDLTLEQYTFAAKAMSKFGVPGVVYPGAGLGDVGRASRISAAQLIILQNQHGWQIASQGGTTEDVTALRSMSDAGRMAEYAKWRNLANSLGLMGSIDGSYYSGYGVEATDLAPTSMRSFRTMRLYGSTRNAPQPPIIYGEMAPFADRYAVQSLPGDSSRYNVTNGYSTALKLAVDQTARNKGVLTLVFHNNLTSGNPNLQQTFIDMLADVTSRTDVQFATMDSTILDFWSGR